MAFSGKINIILADDNLLFLEGLSLLLSTNTNLNVIETCRNGAELVNSRLLSLASLLLVDIEMPAINGIDAAQQINHLFPHLPMVAMTMHHDKIFLNDILGAGFKGFIYKPDVTKVLFDVIKMVLNNEIVFPGNLNTYQ